MTDEDSKCLHCGDPVSEEKRTHWTEGSRGDGYGHRGLCCDCFDLSCDMPLAAINAERARRGAAPIERPWPHITTSDSSPEPE